MNRIGIAVFGIVGSVVVSASAALAQVPAPSPTGLVPPAILSAKKIFVSNAGADSGLFPHPFSGGTERGYNQFYAGLKGTGQWQLVGDPAQADLVLELRLTAPYGPSNADKEKGASDPLPMFRLVVYDAKSHYVLWALTEAVDPASLQKSHDRNFDEALGEILQDFEDVAGKPYPTVH
jgi:hypothetical protein